jgi:hypothetical protein
VIAPSAALASALGLLLGPDGWSVNPRMTLARAAQEQIARFFLSDGRVIERNDERFEVPVAGTASR